MDKKEEKLPPVRDLFVWEAASHPLSQYPKGLFAFFGLVAVFVSVLFILFQEWLAVLVTWAAYFLFFALSRVTPQPVTHKITTQGIVSMNHSYLWEELGPFWFTVRAEEVILHLAHRGVFGQLVILVNPLDREKIRDILVKYLPFIEVPEKSVTDKLSDWLASVVKSA